MVRENAKIIGSVNESREDFENAVSYLRGFPSEVSSALDPLINNLQLDTPDWKVIDSIAELRKSDPKIRSTGPKLVLKA